MSHVVVYESSERHECMEMRLVLNAAGIAAEISHDPSGWLLQVDEAHFEPATAELSAYQQERRSEDLAGVSYELPQPPGTLEGIFAYFAVVVLFAAVNWFSVHGPLSEAVGHLHAGSVLGGQWWRTVTALTLHLDFAHLFSNLIFGAIFGFLAGQMLGGGVAWLLIVLGGTGGNFVNALLRDASHQSIGASTAVFSALGIAVAYALRPSLHTGQRTMQRWSPLIGGVLLLAFLGTGGERTDVDVTAHVTGFLAGLVGGWIASHLPSHWLFSTKLQWAAGLIALALVFVAWGVGFAHAI